MTDNKPTLPAGYYVDWHGGSEWFPRLYGVAMPLSSPDAAIAACITHRNRIEAEVLERLSGELLTKEQSPLIGDLTMRMTFGAIGMDLRDRAARLRGGT